MGRERLPRLCLHRSSGLAYSTDPRTGKERYFGPHGTPEAAEAYAAFCRELEAWRAGRDTPAPPRKKKDAPLTVARLCLLFLDHAERYYRKHGRPTSEVANYRQVIRRLNDRYGRMPAARLGPGELKRLRDAMAAEGLARQTVNAQTRRVRRVWRWAVAEELLPPSVLPGLDAVGAIRKGRGAREGKKVLPVAVEVVDATLPYLAPRTAELVRFILAGGMRPGDAVVCRPRDVDRAVTPWVYRPSTFKTEHHEGAERVIYLGPRARESLGPLLDRCRLASAWVWRGRAGHLRVNALREAVLRAIERANADRAGRNLPPLPHWHPSQLRHTAGTLLRAALGIEAARTVLGHSDPGTTLIYAERDAAQARDAAERFG